MKNHTVQKTPSHGLIVVVTTILCVCFLRAAKAEGDEDAAPISVMAASKNYTPKPAPPVWGDVNRDGNVSLADLVLLGQKWESTEAAFGLHQDTIRTDISRRWDRSVPNALRALGWNNRPITASFASSKFQASLKQIDPTLPKAVGFGVTFPEGSKTEVIGLPVYEIPQGLAPVRQQFRGLEGGYNDHNAFYDFPIEQEVSALQYVRSYEEQQEFLGVDLSIEAKYSIFEGSISSSTEREKYREGRSHKLLYKSTKSFGWVFLPPSEQTLNPEFVAALEGAGDLGELAVLQKFGTHYVYAEHRVGSLIIDLDFTTSLARDRSSFKLEVESALNGATFALNISAAISQIKSTVKDVTSVRLRIHRRGGSPDLVLDDGRSFSAVAASLNADSPNLQNEVALLIGAWNKDINFANAAVDTFYCRPISDFFDATPPLPWDRGKNLRDWYKRWAEYYDLAVASYGVLNPTTNNFTYPNRHFSLIDQSDAPEGASSWLEYFQNKRAELRVQRDGLLEIGRQLYESTPTDTVQFDPNFDFPLPEFRFPRVRFSFEQPPQITNCVPVADWMNGPFYQWNFYGQVSNFSVPNNGQYAWVIVRNPSLNPWACPTWLGEKQWNLENTITPQTNRTDIHVWQRSGQNGGCQCTEYLNRWASNQLDQAPGTPAFSIALIDVDATPNRLIAVGCSSGLCESVDLLQFGVAPAPHL